MAIYRGPGGAGDATADATNAASVAEGFADDAAVSPAAAAGSASAEFHFEFAEGPGQQNPAMNRDLFDTGPTLGIGAFGYVQLVHYKKTGKVYALKTLTKKSILKTDQFVHCRDEIANLRAASNPFIVNLFSCFQDGILTSTRALVARAADCCWPR